MPIPSLNSRKVKCCEVDILPYSWLSFAESNITGSELPSYYHCSINPGNCSRLCYYDNKINGFELEDEGISGYAYVSFALYVMPCIFSICELQNYV